MHAIETLGATLCLLLSEQEARALRDDLIKLAFSDDGEITKLLDGNEPLDELLQYLRMFAS
jgi:hypothetical protein